ncbi:MAG TPA: peroxide stress protein YaaA [Holophagaceae bacterium]
MPAVRPLILLAPSEGKSPGGQPGRLKETEAQAWVRERLEDLVCTGTPLAQKRAFEVKDDLLERARAEALGLKGRVPLLPALERYTGVAFRALDPLGLPRDRWAQVYILSSLRGLVRGDDPVPSYKLKLTGLPGLKAHWRDRLARPLATLPGGPVWELLPEEHAALLKGWQRPRHTLEILDRSGRSITHFSKHYRGLVARWILEHQAGDPAAVLKGRIPGCTWEGAVANDRGGLALTLRMEP